MGGGVGWGVGACHLRTEEGEVVRKSYNMRVKNGELGCVLCWY